MITSLSMLRVLAVKEQLSCKHMQHKRIITWHDRLTMTKLLTDIWAQCTVWARSAAYARAFKQVLRKSIPNALCCECCLV